MILNHTLISAALIAALAPTAPMAQEEAAPTGILAPENFTANVGLTTDYRFRGISNSDGPAVSGGFDWAYNGFSVGVWASNTEFSDGNVEIDYYGGYDYAWNNWAFSIAALYYTFPGEDPKNTEGFDPPGFDPTLFSPNRAAGDPTLSSFGNVSAGYNNRDPGVAADIDANYFEVSVGVAYTFAGLMFEPTVGATYNYSPDYFGEDGDGHHVQASLGASLPWGLAPFFNYGYQHVDGDEFSNFFAVPGYNWAWWNVGVTKEVRGFNLSFAYWDTNYDDDCNTNGVWNGRSSCSFERFYNEFNYATEGNRTYKDLTEGQFVFSISRSF